MRKNSAHGFTLIEMMVVVAIIGLLAALAVASIWRQRPRATLASTVADLRTVVHLARQTALATGDDVAVMVFPNYSTGGGAQGRVILYRDGDMSLFTSTAAVNFSNYDAGALKTGDDSEILRTLDLPKNIVFGPSTGMGTGAKLPAPLDSVKLDASCSFCEDKDDFRGAIVFHSRGHVDFYGAGADLLTALGSSTGQSFSLTSAELGSQASIVVTTFAGAVLAPHGT